MSIESQLYGRYSAAADKAQTLDQLKAIQNDIYKATQSGILHPVEGVPLVQGLTPRIQKAEAAQQQALMMQYAPQAQGMPQGMPQGQPQAPAPIAPQIMSQAQQLSGVDNLRSNLPAEEGYAAGGIIAFADGGLGDIDEGDDEDYGGLNKQEQVIFDQFLSDIGGSEEDYQPRGIESIPASSQSQSGYGVNPEQRGAVNKGISYEEPLPSGGAKGITANIDRDQARKYNVGNLRPSGFTYPGQIGVSGGGFAMFENPEAGIAALNQDIGIKLRRGLDTPLKFISVYAPAADKNDVGAYASNVARALGISPNDRIPDTPQARSILAAAITRQEGAHKATARFASGGPISFASGGSAEEQLKADQEDFLTGAKKLGSAALDVVTLPVRAGMGIVNTGIIGARAVTGADIPYIPEDWFGGSSSSLTPYYDKYARKAPAGSGLTQEEMAIGSGNPANSGLAPATLEGRQDPATYGINNNFAPTAATVAAPEVPEYIREISALLKERAIAAKKQKETDAYMALLQAGLGMMAGTSPYAMANIGQGGSSGIAAYAASRKAQTADENAILAGRLGLSKAELLEKSRQNALAVSEKRYSDKLALEKEIANNNKLRAENMYKSQNVKNTLAAQKIYRDSGDEALLRKEFTEKHGKNWEVDPILVRQFEMQKNQKIRNLSILESDEEGNIPTATSLLNKPVK